MLPPQTPSSSSSKQVQAIVDGLRGKLELYHRQRAGAPVEIRYPGTLTGPERSELLRHLKAFNFVVYQAGSEPLDKQGLKNLGMQLGIYRTDHNFCADDEDISSLEVSGHGDRPRYIPYTDRPLGWHTDGYYYGAGSERTIRSFILHCVRPAPEGGESSLLDPDIVFLLLNELDPSLPVLLSRSHVFSIPPDDGQPQADPGDRSGPVFSVDPASGSLHMRYTARRRNIHWQEHPDVASAVRCMKEVIESAAAYTVHHKLEAGQGIICNNVLHRRTGFVDGDSAATRRLLFRARYHERIPGTAAGSNPGGGSAW